MLKTFIHLPPYLLLFVCTKLVGNFLHALLDCSAASLIVNK